MKNRNTDYIPRMNKTLWNHLEKYRNRIAELPYTNERSRLVDCITVVLEEGSGNEQNKFGVC